MANESINDGGPAFPTDNAAQTGNATWHFQGMSLRDYLAAHAPMSLQDAKTACLSKTVSPPTGQELVDMLAAMKYVYADAMLKARSA